MMDDMRGGLDWIASDCIGLHRIGSDHLSKSHDNAAQPTTTLAALRPAVSEVLKPKLAKDAINNADEELRE